MSAKNKAAFDKVMKPYVEAGTKVAGRRNTPSKSGRSTGKRTDLNVIREWATANGYEVSSRGRIKSEVTNAYDAAH